MIEFSKKTGDYAVLSRPDQDVLALTYAVEVQAHGTWRIREVPGGKTGQQLHEEQRLQEKAAAAGNEPPAGDAPPASAKAATAPRPAKGAPSPAPRPASEAQAPAPRSATPQRPSVVPQAPAPPASDADDGFTTVDAAPG